MKPITVYSSHGEATFDAITGVLIESNLDASFGPPELRPQRIDIPEYKAAWPNEGPLEGVDILDVAYWTVDGQYVPAVEEFRDNAWEQMAEFGVEG